MKKIVSVLFAIVCIVVVSQTTFSQYVDPQFQVVATIKPSDFAGNVWPDSVAAWRVYATYDLDKDGKKEFLVIVDPATTRSSDTSMPRILRFEANGDNKYDLVWWTQIPNQFVTRASWPCLTVGDMDKDGNQEIIFGLPSDARTGTNPNPDVIFFYEYDPGLGNFPTEPTMTSTLGINPKTQYAITSIVVNDVDNDGDVELITSARRYRGPGIVDKRPLFIYHLLGDVSQGFSSLEMEFADTIGTFNGGYYFNNHVVDFDENGKKEIWGYTWDLLSYAVYEATGPNTYVLKADVNQAADADYGEQNSAGFYDANKDGKLEMFIAGQTSPPSAVFYLPNTTDLTTLSTTSTKMITPALDTADFQGAEIGDVDGDGEVDFIIGDWNSTRRKVYRLSHIKNQPFDIPSGYNFTTLYYTPDDSTYRFPNVNIMNDLDGDNKKEIFLVNTSTRGGYKDASIIVLEAKVGSVGVKQISDVVPNQFTLEQNYPNPFNPTSKIRFSLQQAGDVQIVITNTLGQQVGSLVNRHLEAGTHEVTFDAAGLPSGTYFYTLKSGAFTQTKKMNLVR